LELFFWVKNWQTLAALWADAFTCNKKKSREQNAYLVLLFNPLTPNDLKRRRAVSLLQIKLLSKNYRQAALRGGI
jgi:hypothetical protein